MTAVPSPADQAIPPLNTSASSLSWQVEFLEIFLRNQVKLAPIMPILVILMAATTTLWVHWIT
ncbi:MAG: hypothetical protein GYA66_00815 [Phyllobacteriaceae bacterium]|nr:hypothetical protein [Phyllobacteriaceae bacterium]